MWHRRVGVGVDDGAGLLRERRPRRPRSPVGRASGCPSTRQTFCGCVADSLASAPFFSAPLASTPFFSACSLKSTMRSCQPRGARTSWCTGSASRNSCATVIFGSAASTSILSSDACQHTSIAPTAEAALPAARQRRGRLPLVPGSAALSSVASSTSPAAAIVCRCRYQMGRDLNKVDRESRME